MARIRKKAQASAFIIVGIIMLFSAALFIYFRLNYMTGEPDNVPEELQPVKRYVEECMARSAEDAVRLLAEQGGYISIPLSVEMNPAMYANPDGMGIIKMPFWFYKGYRYSPSRESVQMEITRHVEEKTAECINNFEAFRNQYKIVELGEMKAETFLNKEDISIMMEYPIRVYYAANESYTKIEKFSAKLPVRLSLVLDTANKLLDAELRDMFLENFTIDLMASNPDVPFTGMEFSCRRLEWDVNDVKKRVEDMLLYNLPRIRVRDTAHMPFLEDERNYKRLLDYHSDDIERGNMPAHVPDDAYEYFHMFWDIGMEKDESMNIGFRMLADTGIDLIARPHDNGILRSKFLEGSRSFIRFFCINIYHFVYDVNYPVIVSIRDDASFNGEGFIFNFAMPVTIHNNEPYKASYSHDMFRTTYFDRGFCDDRGEDMVDIKVYGKEHGYSGMELSEVNVSMECITYHCELGQTGPDEGRYRLRTALPAACSNPFIIAEKEGYLKARKQITDESEVELEMKKLKKLPYKVVYHRYDSIGEEIGEENELDNDMDVSIQLIGEELEQYKMYPIVEEDDEGMLEIIDGDAEYDIDIILTQDDEYLGGYKGKWSVSAMDAAGADMAVFHVIKYVPVPYTEEDKLNMMDYLMDGDYADELKPELE